MKENALIIAKKYILALLVVRMMSTDTKAQHRIRIDRIVIPNTWDCHLKANYWFLRSSSSCFMTASFFVVSIK